MELNRNQYFFIGLVILLTKFLAKNAQTSASDSALLAISSDMGAQHQKTIQPPEWIGWCLMSIGGVLILHSLAMRKPGAG
jgi:hypothetical protein